jgi:putative transposase
MIRLSGWVALLARGDASKDVGIPACDFPHAGVVFPRRLSVFFVMGIRARRVHIPGITARPAGAWAARQARDLLMSPGGRAGPFRFLIRDRGSRFTAVFGGAFAGNGVRIIKTPVRSPGADSLAERFAGTLRRECPGHLLICSERHLRRVLAGYARHDDGHRLRQSREQRPPLQESGQPAGMTALIKRGRVVRGLVNEYRRAAGRAHETPAQASTRVLARHKVLGGLISEYRRAA